MADVSSSYCDVCGALKKEANHWFRVWTNDIDVVISPWNRILDTISKHQHACGEGHALKLAARLLGKRDVAPGEQE